MGILQICIAQAARLFQKAGVNKKLLNRLF